MAGRGRRSRTSAPSSSRPAPRRQRAEPITPEEAEAQYRERRNMFMDAISKRKFNSEKIIVGWERSPRFMEGIKYYGLEKLLDVPNTRRESIVGTYFVAYNTVQSREFRLREVDLPEITPAHFASRFDLNMVPECRFAAFYRSTDPYPMQEVLDSITMPGHLAWEGVALKKGCCPPFIKNWIHFLSSNVLPIWRRGSINKKLMLLLHLIVHREPLCFPTIMCEAFHANVVDCKLEAKERTPRTAIAFPHFVTAFCEMHGVNFRAVDIEANAEVFSLLKDIPPSEYPPPPSRIDPRRIALGKRPRVERGQGSRRGCSEDEQDQSSGDDAHSEEHEQDVRQGTQEQDLHERPPEPEPYAGATPAERAILQMLTQLREDFQAAEFQRMTEGHRRDREIHKLQANISRIMEHMHLEEYVTSEEDEGDDGPED